MRGIIFLVFLTLLVPGAKLNAQEKDVQHRWDRMSPTEKERFQQRKEKFEKMDPDRQKKIQKY